jgi:biotin carboxyl carrier protein
MKVEQAVRAPHAGRVAALRAEPGEQVEAGRVLALIEPEAPDA